MVSPPASASAAAAVASVAVAVAVAVVAADSISTTGTANHYDIATATTIRSSDTGVGMIHHHHLHHPQQQQQQQDEEVDGIDKQPPDLSVSDVVVVVEVPVAPLQFSDGCPSKMVTSENSMTTFEETSSMASTLIRDNRSRHTSTSSRSTTSTQQQQQMITNTETATTTTTMAIAIAATKQYVPSSTAISGNHHYINNNNNNIGRAAEEEDSDEQQYHRQRVVALQQQIPPKTSHNNTLPSFFASTKPKSSVVSSTQHQSSSLRRRQYYQTNHQHHHPTTITTTFPLPPQQQQQQQQPPLQSVAASATTTTTAAEIRFQDGTTIMTIPPPSPQEQYIPTPRQFPRAVVPNNHKMNRSWYNNNEIDGHTDTDIDDDDDDDDQVKQEKEEKTNDRLNLFVFGGDTTTSIIEARRDTKTMTNETEIDSPDHDQVDPHQHRLSFFADQSMLQLRPLEHNDDDDDDEDQNEESSFVNATSIAIVPSKSGSTITTTIRRRRRRQTNHDAATDDIISINDVEDECELGHTQQQNNHHTTTTHWEEEATPEQTQFGKLLLFRRQINNINDIDNLSTASNHGSLSVEDDDDDENKIVDIVTHKVSTTDNDSNNESNSTYYQTPLQEVMDTTDGPNHHLHHSIDEEEEEGEEIAIPTVAVVDATTMNDPNDLPIVVSEPFHVGTITTVAAITTPMTMTTTTIATTVNHNNRNVLPVTTTTTKHSSYENTAKKDVLPDFQYLISNSILKRFGTTNNGTTASNNTTSYAMHQPPPSQQSSGQRTVSQSAPTTPRASTTWYNNYNHSTTPTRTATTSGNNLNNSNVERRFPSSFLLRSPGSIPFQTVSRDNTFNNRRYGDDIAANNDGADRYNATTAINKPSLSSSFWFSSFGTPRVTATKDDDNTTVDSPDTVDSSSDKKQNVTNGHLFKRPIAVAKTTPFHLVARSCFSFDAYDTSMDDHYDIPNNNSIQYTTTGTTASTSMEDIVQRHYLPIPDLDHPTIQQPITRDNNKHKSRPFVGMKSADSSSIFKRTAFGPDISYSASWDVSSTTSTVSPTKSRKPSYQYSTSTYRRPSQTDSRRMFRPNHHRWGASTVTSNINNPRPSLSTSSSLSSPKRSVPEPKEANNDDFTQQLKSPQRIEIERNDAIDILACLVERGVSWKQPPIELDTTDTAIERKVNPVQLQNRENSDDQNSHRYGMDDEISSPADIVLIVEELQGLSLAEENLSDYNNKNTMAHQKRKLALEELVRSHEYAMEMKRASQSASSWLKSIGRSQSTSPSKPSVSSKASPARNMILSESTTPRSNSPNNSRQDDAMEMDETTTVQTEKSHQTAGEESSASDNIDILTLKAMLHSSQIEVKEKTDLADRLNEELAKCRAEIGRLKSSAQSMSFRSPNRSILDESDDAADDDDDDDNGDDPTSPGRNCKEDPTRIFETDRIIVDDNDCLDSSFLREDGPLAVTDIAPLLEIDRYRAALTAANVKIQQLYHNLQKYSNERDDGTAPLVLLPPIETALSMNETAVSMYERPRSIDHGAENTRTIDVADLTTDWVELDPPLPNPPEHDLQSPIITAVLDLWTSDRTLQESLMDWIEQTLAGRDSDSIPPLTLSNVDHQARDGFVLHLLPLLLRRPDISVDVKTRIHRRTTYDLAVSISPTAEDSEFRPPQDQHINATISTRAHNFEFDDANNSAVTSHISNTAFASLSSQMEEYSDYGTPKSIADRVPAMSRLSYDEMAEDIALSETSQTGLFSTLGSALGGLLLPRNRNVGVTTTATSPRLDYNNMNDEPKYLNAPPSSRRSIMNGTNMPTIMESPKTIMSDTQQQSDDVVRFVELDHDPDSCNVEQSLPSSYHRVVSAPSGRIGVTFVDYRGHCMVSDVSHDSPLIGWIFPSDVLIAIDDIPVSGMQIRDIIKLLKDRNHNLQRALRVISSHAMNELTLNASLIVNDTTG